MNHFWQNPALGYTHEFDRTILQVLDAWFHLQQTSFDYQLVLLDIWLKTIEEFLRVSTSFTESGETMQHWQHFLRRWSEIFDRTFAQTFQSEHSLQIRGKFLNASLVFKNRQQQLVEVFLKWNNLPSRSEIDEIHRSIYELRKEVKNLQKTLVELQKP